MSPSLSFMDDNSESEEYEDSDSESEDPFTSHQARRQTASGSQRGAMAPFYNYPGAGWTPPFSSAPPLPWVTPTHRHKDRQTDRTPQMLHEEEVEVALRYSSGTQLVFLCRGLYLWATFIQVRDCKKVQDAHSKTTHRHWRRHCLQTHSLSGEDTKTQSHTHRCHWRVVEVQCSQLGSHTLLL